eukprot:jgi/Galph1/1120/GphlegSOOS_G5799.1
MSGGSHSDGASIRLYADLDQKVFLVWNVDDCKRLRNEHRILGELVGTLPGHVNQNAYLGLPLQLSMEEVSVGCLNGKYYVITGEGFLEIVSSEFGAEHQAEEATPTESGRGKKRKLSDSRVDEENSFEIVEPLHKRHKMVFGKEIAYSTQLFLQSLPSSFRSIWKKNVGTSTGSLQDMYLNRHMKNFAASQDDKNSNINSKNSQTMGAKPLITIPVASTYEEATPIEHKVLYRKGMPFPSFLPLPGYNDPLRRRVAVFLDLWQRGFYLSSGVKFGADFLAYAGDPILFHASLAVSITERDAVMSPRDMVAFGRLGVSTRKRATLAYVEESTEDKNGICTCQLVVKCTPYRVRYLCIRWCETLP